MRNDSSDRVQTGWVPCDSCKTHKTFRHKAGDKVLCDVCHGREWSKAAARDSG